MAAPFEKCPESFLEDVLGKPKLFFFLHLFLVERNRNDRYCNTKQIAPQKSELEFEL